jgi:hypothetical protein
MKKFPLALGVALACLIQTGVGGARRDLSVPGSGLQQIKTLPPNVNRTFGKMPLYFIANEGQLDEKVAYYVQGKDKSLYFTPEGVTIVLSGSKKEKDGPENRILPGPLSRDRERAKTESASDARWVVKLDFVGANPSVKPMGVEETGAVISYFKGKPEEWKTGLPTYSKIIYQDLWPGIDLLYYGTVDRMKYEFIVHPGADPSMIRFAYRGASAVEVTEDGRLAVTTPAGGFEDDVPVAWQEVEGKKADVPVAYDLVDCTEARHPGGPQETEESGSESVRHEYGFKVGDYDHSRPLVLDPAVLVYCGFIGGSGPDGASGIAVDGSRNAYVVGTTGSTETSFPVVVGPDLTGSPSDAFVAKVNASGTALVYCGYIGGSSSDIGYGIAVDNLGNAYITGDTSSTEATFPVVLGPDLTSNDGPPDAFVAKVNASGTSLVYCGYIGGSGMDTGCSIAVDGSGNAYVTGYTDSPEWQFPVVVGPDLTLNGSGGLNVFVAKVNDKGTGLDYCGYIGSGQGFGIAVDGSGNAYVTGQTGETEATFPVVVGPDLTHNGLSDVFVAKVNATGTALAYCGYIGGSGYDLGRAIAVDSSGYAYVAGETRSAEDTFPVVTGPDLTYNNPGLDRADAFVAKINPTGTALVYCGYIGGVDSEYARGIAVDDSGNAYIAGKTWSTEATFPVVSGPDLTYNDFGITPAPGDAFVAKVNATGTALAYCGYIGARSDDEAWGIAVDDFGGAYVAGGTDGTDWFPVVTGPDLTANGNRDAFVAKISEVATAIVTVTSPNGGEIWAAGAVHYITWATIGTIANVKLESSTDGGTIWATIIASTANTNTYAWTVPGTISSTCLVRVNDAANAAIQDTSDAVFSIIAGTLPTIELSRKSFNFGSERNGTPTPAGISVITNTGTGILTWAATPSTDWISVSPGSGTGSGILTIGISRTDLPPGSYTGTISVTAPGASNSPQTINVGLNILPAGSSGAPFGSFDTPIHNSTVSSSIAVTGWALDDVEATGVKIYRNPMSGEPAQPNGLVYIGDGVFVEGARPDVEAKYPNYPLNSRAGWGYMLLTNFLPNGGNGSFTLYAYATDREGHEVQIGSKTITCDNLHAVRPFGAIDTPTQGGQISGSLYYNFGWALTPLPNSIPTDGSTIWVWVDGLPLAHPSYNNYRGDIATLFPGYANSNAAVGVYELNTTAFTNGVHTIAWSVVDNAGNEDGIGSRYFSILNTGTPPLQSEALSRGSLTILSVLSGYRDVSKQPIYSRRGFDRSRPPNRILPLSKSANPKPGEGLPLVISELERAEILLDDRAFTADMERGKAERAGLAPGGGFPASNVSAVARSVSRWEGYLIVGEELRRLPIGSTLDETTGVFSWLPGPGFLGDYQLVFINRENKSRACVTIRIEPRYRTSRASRPSSGSGPRPFIRARRAVTFFFADAPAPRG